jgi:CO/xanthine dehydrogenase Mo-binding subunit
MQVDVLKLELVEGEIRMVGGEPGPSMTITEIAYQAHNFRLSLPDDPELTSGLDESYVYDHPATTEPPADRSHMGIFYPIMGHSCHIPVVEVDIETGQVSILKYIAVHDCGTIVNPITLDGHIRGGTVNGIGTALLEHYKYNDDGQLESALFTDYLLPSVHESPEDIICDHVETPSPFTEYGIKGGGEGGRMGAPPAIVGAIEDALRPLGVKIDCVPVGPARLKQLIREARKQDH